MTRIVAVRLCGGILFVGGHGLVFFVLGLSDGLRVGIGCLEWVRLLWTTMMKKSMVVARVPIVALGFVPVLVLGTVV